jgi:hypothetical protein
VSRFDADGTSEPELARGRAEHLQHPRGAIDEPTGLVTPVAAELDAEGTQGIRRYRSFGGDQHPGAAGEEERRWKAAGVRSDEVPEVLRSGEERAAEPVVVEMAPEPGEPLPADNGR